MQPVSTRISSPGAERALLQRAAGVHERPAVALQPLHDEAFAAEQTRRRASSETRCRC